MQNCAISAKSLGQLLESFFADAPHAVALENGELLFNFSSARYSVSGEGKCVLHLWSDERNAVRRVLDAELKPRVLRLSVLRFGQSQPTILEICSDPAAAGSATALRAIRGRYKQIFERVLLREFPGYKLDSISNRADLEHSCSPVYTRAVLRQGQSAFAVLGVSGDETQPSIDERAHLRHSLDEPPARAACGSRPCRWTQALRTSRAWRNTSPAHGPSRP